MQNVRHARRIAILAIGLLICVSTIAWFLASHLLIQWTLNQNQQRWTRSQPMHYRYTLELMCLCPPQFTKPVSIEVKNGVTTSITYVEDGTPAEPAYFDRYATIEKLFAVLQEALGRPGARLNVTYHSHLGYPMRAAIDYQPNAVDDEIYFTVRDVVALP